MKTKLLYKSMIVSKLLSLLKDLSNPKSLFTRFPSLSSTLYKSENEKMTSFEHE